MKFHGIAFRLAALTLIVSLSIFLICLGYNYRVSRDMIIDNAKERGLLIAQSASDQIGSELKSVEKVVNSVAFSLEEGELTEKRIRELGQRILNENPDIFGTAIAFEPYKFSPKQQYFSPYYYHVLDDISYTKLGGDNYQYFYMDWYQLPKELQKPVWTEPYFDEGAGRELITTYAVPFYRNENGERVLTGVVTADISLSWVQKLLRKIKIYDTGYSFMLSRYGTYIAHPDNELVMNETIFSHAENLNWPNLRNVAEKIMAGNSGFAELQNIPRVGDSFIYYVPLKEQKWSIGVVSPKKEMFADVMQLSRDVVMMGAAGFFALTLFIVLLSRNITRPLRKLTASAKELASGNLGVALPRSKSKDEVGELTEAFRTMRTSLKEYIINLTATTAAKERIEAELKIAHDIQMGILPKLFPAFPERAEFDVYASIEPANEVGGDLYDFFFIDDKHFCFLIGDVSGKGVPAAFFMAVTKTLLKVVAERALEPGDILAKVNNGLAEDNDSCMFVTLFLAVINIETGELKYASAGHNPPVLLSNNTAQWIPPMNELVAGVMEDVTYTTKSLIMSPGDTLFIYTDGVTEAMDSEKSLYSDEYLLKTLGDCGRLNAKDMLARVEHSIKTFTGGAAQSDDITMLAMQYLGKPNK